MANGGCHCGDIKYEVSGEAHHSSLCYCEDCCASSGAPVVGWTAFAEGDLKITSGSPIIYESSEHGRRHFCGKCGSGLFYYNASFLPGIVDINTTSFDDPEGFAPGVAIQVADRLKWMEAAHELPQFERYPDM